MKEGDRVSWRSINQDFTGIVVGFHGHDAVVELIQRPGKVVLLSDNDKKPKK